MQLCSLFFSVEKVEVTSHLVAMVIDQEKAFQKQAASSVWWSSLSFCQLFLIFRAPFTTNIKESKVIPGFITLQGESERPSNEIT